MPRVQNDGTGRFETVYSDRKILALLDQEGKLGRERLRMRSSVFDRTPIDA
jgi:hypothetical protein